VARAPFLKEEYVQGVKARILARLAAARGAVVPHDVLALAAYGDRGPDDAAGVIRQLVYRLRKRLPPGSLTTVWGRGYRLDAEVARTLPLVDDRVLLPADDAR
jgi:DNA-binding response OmpR family regulator